MKKVKKTKVNKVVNFRLTLLGYFHEKLTQSDIARKTGKSKVYIHKQTASLLKDGYIIELKTWPKTYGLTDKVNQILTHHEKKVNYDLHAVEIAYNLLSTGRLPEGDVNLKNWSYYAEKLGNFYFRVNYGKAAKLLIYPPNVHANNKADLLFKLGSAVSDIVALIESKYACQVDRHSRTIVRRPEVHAPNDPIGKKFEGQGVDQKCKNIEINQSGHAHFDVVGLDSFDKYDYMISNFPKLVENQAVYAQHLTAHIPVLLELIKTLPEFRQALTHMTSLITGKQEPKPQIEPQESWEAMGNFARELGE